MKNSLLKLAFIAIIGFNLLFCSWYVLHGDINFYSDIGRDFLILKELDQKKILLIGPRSSGNLFHGPAWAYLNYPFYLIGKGNPVIVGWGWVFYISVFAVGCYFIAKKLFDKKTAYLFSAMVFLYMGFHARDMINPHGALFFLPLFFYLFIRYFETLKSKYLIAHFLVGALMIQMALALGIPLVIMSFFAILYKQIKTKNLRQIPYFLFVILGLINFFVFDFRHNFLIAHNALEFISPKSGGQVFNYVQEISQRISLAFSGVEILRSNIFDLNFFLMLGILVFIYIQVKNNKYKLIYFSFLYFYFGYFVLSFIDKGPILYFYQFPFFPLVFLIFCSFITSKYRYIFLLVYVLVLLLNMKNAISDMHDSYNIIGKQVYSWKFLDKVATTVFSGKENRFGYFVYAPDALAYSPKYAMFYEASKSRKQAEYFKKEHITYITVEPPPLNNPYMLEGWWIANKANIKATPSSVIKFDNGYKIYKFELSKEEVLVSPDSTIDTGLNFR